MSAKKQFDYSQIRALVKSRNFTDWDHNDSGVIYVNKRYFVIFKGEIVFDHARKRKAFSYLEELEAQDFLHVTGLSTEDFLGELS
jgi:hypothetical protein